MARFSERTRRRRWLVGVTAITAAFALVAAACGGDDSSNNNKSSTESTLKGQKANTGKVNLMSAGEPEETQAYQQIFDDMINSKVDYKVTVESVGNFEEQFQIRAKGGTLDVAAVPQPG